MNKGYKNNDNSCCLCFEDPIEDPENILECREVVGAQNTFKIAVPILQALMELLQRMH